MIGQTIGQYRVLQELGRGSAGIVYLAEDTRLGRTVALKALAPEAVRDAKLRDQLRHEARMAANLSHPGIVTVYDLYETADQLFVVYEYVKGETLRAEIERGPIPPGTAVQTGLEIARALIVPHAHGMVHRDLKPENIIRCADGAVKILDFGLAGFKSALAGRTSGAGGAGAVVGTVGYMSPEQLEGGKVDARTDIFSLGVLLYELTSGTHPFAASTPASTSVRILTSEPLSLMQRNPASPEPLDRIVRKCLRKDPQERYTSIEDLLLDLERLTGAGEPRPAPPRFPEEHFTVPPVPPGGARSPRWWWQFHQLCVAALYCAAVYPVWIIRAEMMWGLFFFFALLICATVAAVLRGHLWFTSRFYPYLLSPQVGRLKRWIGGLDWALALFIFAGVAAGARAYTGIAVFLVVIAVAILISSLILEPATASAAFSAGPSSGQTTGSRT